MIDLTGKISIQNVIDRWKNQYFQLGVWRNGDDKKIIYRQLLQLQKNDPLNLNAIDDIIGNGGWTHNMCSCCNKSTRKTLVSFDVNGGEYGYELCKKCLKKSLRMLGGSTKELKALRGMMDLYEELIPSINKTIVEVEKLSGQTLGRVGFEHPAIIKTRKLLSKG